MTELIQEIGPVVVRRLSEDRIILGLHMDSPDGCAVELDVGRCNEISQALRDVTRTDKVQASAIEPFSVVLRRRCEAVSGMLFQAHTHSGIISWLARQCSVTPMTTGRYLQGKVHPVPYIARRISTALEWPWDELVASILEERVGRAVRDHYRKYHTCVQVGNSEPR